MQKIIKTELANAHVAAYWLNMAESLRVAGLVDASDGPRLMADFEVEPKEVIVLLPKRSGSSRQAAYAGRQRALGRVQRSLWLSDAEAVAVGDFVNLLRESL